MIIVQSLKALESESSQKINKNDILKILYYFQFLNSRVASHVTDKSIRTRMVGHWTVVI